MAGFQRRWVFPLLFPLLIQLLGCFAVRDEKDRNLIHFSTEGSWCGPPAALLYTKLTSRLHLYWEEPQNGEMTTNATTRFGWGHASSEDGGQTWKSEGGFLKPPLEKAESITQGSGVYSNLSDEYKYLFVYGQTTWKEGAMLRAIWNRFSKDGTLGDGSTQLREAATHPTVFNYAGETYLASLGGIEQCVVSFALIRTSSRTSKTLEWSGAGSFSTSFKDKCRSPQIFQLGLKWVLVISHMPASEPSRSYYFMGSMTVDRSTPNTPVLTFKPDTESAKGLVFDHGHDAQDFKFTAMVTGQVIGIGWNGNAYYPNGYPTTKWKNGMTVLRRILMEGGRLVQQPVGWASKLLGSETFGENERLSNQECSVSHSFAHLKDGIPAAHVFVFHFESEDEFHSGGFEISFRQSLKEDFKRNLREVVKQDPKTTPSELAQGLQGQRQLVSISVYEQSLTEFEFTVNRTETKPFTKLTVAAGTFIPLSKKTAKLEIILDASTVEIFGDDGRFVVTESFFLNEQGPLSKVCVRALGKKVILKNATVTKYASIWSSPTVAAPNKSQPSGTLSPTVAVPDKSESSGTWSPTVAVSLYVLLAAAVFSLLGF